MNAEEKVPHATVSPANAAEPQLAGHEYDGIREYDNPLPAWWVWIFWGTFAFSVAYYVHFQLTGNGDSVAVAYEADMTEFRDKQAERELGSEVNDEALTTLMGNPAMMKDAESTYKLRCLQCHGDKGQGLIGPNLTDSHWIHGKGALLDIYKVVNEGVLSKGMPTWGRQLKPMELRKVVAYVGKLRNTNVPGRPAEGLNVPISASAPGGGG